jgi:hypothetical protein
LEESFLVQSGTSSSFKNCVTMKVFIISTHELKVDLILECVSKKLKFFNPAYPAYAAYPAYPAYPAYRQAGGRQAAGRRQAGGRRVCG